MIVIEEGISGRSAIISMASSFSGLSLMIICLQEFDETTSLWVQMAGVVVTLALFAVGFLAWTGKLEKKKQPVVEPTPEPVEEVVKQEPIKLDTVDDWLDKYKAGDK